MSTEILLWVIISFDLIYGILQNEMGTWPFTIYFLTGLNILYLCGTWFYVFIYKKSIQTEQTDINMIGNQYTLNDNIKTNHQTKYNITFNYVFAFIIGILGFFTTIGSIFSLYILEGRLTVIFLCCIISFPLIILIITFLNKLIKDLKIRTALFLFISILNYIIYHFEISI